MSLYNVLMSLGVVVLIGILLKGFWGVTRIEPLKQPDNAQSDGVPPT
jgi:FtsZ-interacting cell division protein ZipA